MCSVVAEAIRRPFQSKPAPPPPSPEPPPPSPSPMTYVQPIMRDETSASRMPRDRVGGGGSGLGARNATQVAQLGGINRRTGAV